MVEKEYRRLLLTELRLVVIPERVRSTDSIKDSELQKAITLNQNLRSLGVTLKPEALMELLLSDCADTFYNEIKDLTGTVDAEPMYPDFPKTIMEIDEAQYRMHQLIHYFSTYGVEELFGAKVSKGWIPDTKKTEKVKSDKTLLEAKVLEIVREEEVWRKVLSIILARKERLTIPETELVGRAVSECSPEMLQGLQIPFKENLYVVFWEIFHKAEKPVLMLRELCQHTGDVLKCLKYVLARKHYKLRTSEKRIFVRLFEQYPVVDFRENLIPSKKKSEEFGTLINFISFNDLSRSVGHKLALQQLRDGTLRSWESKFKKLLADGEVKKAVVMAGERPGFALRNITLLVRNGADPEEILRVLGEKAEHLSTETLVVTLTKFGLRGDQPEEKIVCKILEKLLERKLLKGKCSLAGKKVFIDEGDFSLAHSVFELNEKSEEGGYIRSGFAYRIPEEAQRIRFFVYWNDRNRVDVDLHAGAVLQNGHRVHVGWNGKFRDGGIFMSGDLTHSDAAEFVDIDLSGQTSKAAFQIHLFSGKPNLCDIETCFCGIMAVKEIGSDVQLYNPKNCFFSHDLKSKGRTIDYGLIDTEERVLIFNGKPAKSIGNVDLDKFHISNFTIRKYLDMLFTAQGIEKAETKDEADVILTVRKPLGQKEISLIDKNFFFGEI